MKKNLHFAKFFLSLIIFSGLIQDVHGQEELEAVSNSVTEATSGTNDNFFDALSVSVDVTNINAVLVAASFETKYAGSANERVAKLKLTYNSNESPTMFRTLQRTSGDDKGIGTLVYIFDVSGETDSQSFVLKHASNTNQAILTTGTLAAIPLTTATSHIDLDYSLKSITSGVAVSSTLNTWEGVSGLSSDTITLDHSGAVYVSASINTSTTGPTATGSWKLQYSSDNTTWYDMGINALRSMSATNDYGISNLVWIMDGLDAGDYYFRVAHTQTSGIGGSIQTSNTCLVSCALNYTDVLGKYRSFMPFAVSRQGAVTNSTTNFTDVITASGSPQTNGTGLFMHAQYLITADGVSDSPSYDLYIDNGIFDGQDQQRYVSSGSDQGSGGSVGLATGLQTGTTYTASLRHQSTSGITLSTSNSVLCGFQLTDIITDIWTGAVSTDWTNASNWNLNSIPTSSTVVIVPDVTTDPIISSDITINRLAIESGGAVTVEPGVALTVTDSLFNHAGTSGLIIKADATETGTLLNNSAGIEATVQSYLTGNQWHVVSPGASGESISSFIQEPDNAVPQSGNNYGMMDYNESTNSWNSYFTSAVTQNFVSGKGYCLRCSSSGVVSYPGTLTKGTKTVSLTKSGEGWNCIGNPYPSAIGINMSATSAENFITENSDHLDESYACVYVWDDVSGSYKISGNASYGDRDLNQNYLQAGQGFFVKAASDGEIVSFTTNMKSEQSSLSLKSAETPWPYISLIATCNQKNALTLITFNSKMTTGLDKTYDAGLLYGNSGLEIYSRLIEDNGIDFAIQCLPVDYRNLVIPIGLNCDTGGKITFSAEIVELPAEYSVILEDKKNQTFVDLTDGETYQTSVEAGATKPGRFYLHSSNSAIMKTTHKPEDKELELELKVYYANDKIIIQGNVNSQAKAYLYNLNGQKLMQYHLQQGTQNIIPATDLSPGVYLLQVTVAEQSFMKKIVIY
jgi:hypothetical protein